MIHNILTLNSALRAEKPYPGFAGDFWATGSRSIGLTLLIGTRWTRDISSGSSASPAKRSVANVLIVLSEFVIDVAEDIAVRIGDPAVIVYETRSGERRLPARLISWSASPSCHRAIPSRSLTCFGGSPGWLQMTRAIHRLIAHGSMIVKRSRLSRWSFSYQEGVRRPSWCVAGPLRS